MRRSIGIPRVAATKGRASRLSWVPTGRPGMGEAGRRGRAAGDSRVAGPRDRVPASPPTLGLAYTACCPAGGVTWSSQWSPARGEATAEPSGREVPAPQEPAPEREPGGVRGPHPVAPGGARAPLPTLWYVLSPLHCPRLSRTCPGHPAPGSAGWPQTRCPPPSRRRRLGRRRSEQ